jgi:carboxymethylenebutenolidase
MSAWAPAAKARGGVLVIHENRGLNNHIRSVAGRLAAGGYSALALDLLSEEGGTAAVGDEVAVMAALAAVPPQRFTDDMKSGLTELQRRLPRKRLAAMEETTATDQPGASRALAVTVSSSHSTSIGLVA